MVYVPWACVEEAQNILSPRLGRRGGTREPVKMGKWKDLLLCLDLIAGEGGSLHVLGLQGTLHHRKMLKFVPASKWQMV